MTFDTPSVSPSAPQRAHGGRSAVPEAPRTENAGDPVAQRAATRPASLTPQAMVHLQRLAGNQAVVASVQRMCGVDDSKVTIEDSAMKHKVGLQGQAPRLLSAEEVKKQFHINMKFGKPKEDDRDPAATQVLGGGTKMVFKKTGDSYKVFHFHAYGYEGDREPSSSSGSRSGSSGGRWQRDGGSGRRW